MGGSNYGSTLIESNHNHQQQQHHQYPGTSYQEYNENNNCYF